MTLKLNQTRALVLFSGGQDSATCLADALARFDHVETVGVDYGQRHRVELDVRESFRAGLIDFDPAWRSKLGPDHILDLGFLAKIGATAMTADLAIVAAADGLPNTFVPGRNLMFLTAAGALAYRRNLGVIIGGMCETDFSGYPDCRAATMKAQQQTLRLGMDTDISLEMPLMNIDKAATWQLADDLGGPALVELICEHTHTCYLGQRSERHLWGYGCGTCPACELRAAGYEKYRQVLS
ncbi:MAG: 7-cyano-7-deazaguanine synthase QueC [Parvularculaceae bacterium]